MENNHYQTHFQVPIIQIRPDSNLTLESILGQLIQEKRKRRKYLDQCFSTF